MKVVRVLLPLVKLFPLDYIVPDNMKLIKGDLVIVSFRKKEITGIVWEQAFNSNISKLKTIITKLNFNFNSALLSLINKTAEYYLTELGSIAKLTLPMDIAIPPRKIIKQLLPGNFTLANLSQDQNKALEGLKSSPKPSVIKGVTGSGKTEIYFHLIAQYLTKGLQVLILLPEIALSTQVIKHFEARFGFTPAIWNSSVSKAKKKATLHGILSEDIKVIIGARSSLFLPYSNLGLIIIDEEHDISYKQEEGVFYHARDMAVLRANLSNIKIVLCSATPSIETIYNAQLGKYSLIELNNRYKEALMPDIEIIDMKQEKLLPNSWLSPSLITAINETLIKKEQVLLFLNRRGYCPLVLCKKCGYKFTCPNCSSWLVLHSFSKKMECHHCSFVSRIHTSCPECSSSDSLTFCGPGIERIEEEIKCLFPTNKVGLMSKDQILKPEKIKELLHKMENQEIEILIGTQIITKGYHFPNLTLVGVIDADFGFSGGDLRSSERTFQLLHQVGGRAGRENKSGKVYLQTYYPDNIVLNTLKNKDEDHFINLEIENRREANMPPFTKMASIILSGKQEAKLLKFAKIIVAAAPISQARILGPARAIMSKLGGHYRYRILIIADKKFNLQKYLYQWRESIKIPATIRFKIDIDPQNFI